MLAVTEPTRGAVGGRLWFSPDGGTSWSDATGRLDGAFDAPTGVPGAPPSLKGVVDTHAHAAAPLRVLVQGAGATHWVTDDGGVSFTRVPTPGNGTTLGWYSEFKLHPKRADWILAKVRRSACVSPAARATSNPAACTHDLFVSLDFARTWKNLTAASRGAVFGFNDWEWGAALRSAGAAATTAPDERILATGWLAADHVKGPRPGWDVDMHFLQSDTFFEKKLKTFACANQIEVVGETLYVAMPATCATDPAGR